MNLRFELPGPFRPLTFFLFVVGGGGAADEAVRPAVKGKRGSID